jgi:hypothetical protein
MKTFLFLTLSLLTTVGLANQPLYSCTNKDNVGNVISNISVYSDIAEIRFDTPAAPALRFVIQKANYSPVGGNPRFHCSDKHGEVSIRVDVYDRLIQIFKSAPTMKFMPVQYNVTGFQG